jgi:cell division protein ZapB
MVMGVASLCLTMPPCQTHNRRVSASSPVSVSDDTLASSATSQRELQLFEARLDELIVLAGQLREENRSLRLRVDALTLERAMLLQKNEQVRTRVEAMIGRLKAMEHGA